MYLVPRLLLEIITPWSVLGVGVVFRHFVEQGVCACLCESVSSLGADAWV
jgi:hypothetical protein